MVVNVAIEEIKAKKVINSQGRTNGVRLLGQAKSRVFRH